MQKQHFAQFAGHSIFFRFMMMEEREFGTGIEICLCGSNNRITDLYFLIYYAESVNTVRVDETPVHNAVREALVNCLVNADYFLPRGVVIDSYEDRIVFKNPGTIIVGKRQMLKGGDSEPRNANIMKMFNLIGMGEHAGSGVPDIFSAWEWAGYDKPVVDEVFGKDGPSKTVLTLPLIRKNQDVFEKQPEKQPKKQPDYTKSDIVERRTEAIVNYIKRNPESSRTRIARDLSFTEGEVRTVIEQLKKKGRIHHVGTTRGGRWVVDEDN